MTRDIILSSILKNESLIRYAKKTTNGNLLWEDIMSEMTLYLYEIPEDRFISIYRSEGLLSYCYKIIHLSWNSPRSDFYRKYRVEEPRTENVTFEYNPEIDILYNKCKDEINKITEEISSSRYPTESKMFEIYLECGSYRKTAKKLQLPTMTVFNLINGFKEKIKARL